MLLDMMVTSWPSKTKSDWNLSIVVGVVRVFGGSPRSPFDRVRSGLTEWIYMAYAMFFDQGVQSLLLLVGDGSHRSCCRFSPYAFFRRHADIGLFCPMWTWREPRRGRLTVLNIGGESIGTWDEEWINAWQLYRNLNHREEILLTKYPVTQYRTCMVLDVAI
jgi:hypothetical protein